MFVSRPPHNQAGQRAAVTRGAKAPRARKAWKKETRRGVVAGGVVTLLMGLLLSGYGVHSQMSNFAARENARTIQAARDTKAALRSGPVMFVPLDGNVCRRRVIDNTTWKVRDGGDVICDELVSAPHPEQQYKVEKRLDAIRNTFQARAAGKME